MEERWRPLIKQRTYSKESEGNKKWWYTHKKLRGAFQTIKNSTDNMFLYLEDSSIPKDTNGLEAEFTHLKNKLNSHRGMTKKRQIGFTNWYWFFKSRLG